MPETTIKVKGRYPYRNRVLKPESISTDFSAHENDVTLRLDDSKNLDFWMEIEIPKEQLEKMLKEIKEINDEPAATEAEKEKGS